MFSGFKVLKVFNFFSLQRRQNCDPGKTSCTPFSLSHRFL